MFTWIRSMFQRRDEVHDDKPDHQERRQQQQFDAWRDTLNEVNRVQELAVERRHADRGRRPDRRRHA